MASFVLVHGAWHGAWCWERLVPALEAAGHRALAIDLPGHGDDPTPPGDVSLASYAGAVREAARRFEERVILVGHSMGGIVATQAAHDEPSRFGLIVYLAAFPPRDGESLLSLGSADTDTLIRGAVESAPDTLVFRPERAREVFYADCSETVARDAAARLRPNPAKPMAEAASLPNDIPVPRAYVECSEDRAISPAFQRELASRVPIARTVTLSASHSPFLSMPEELARCLDDLAPLAI